MFDTDELRKGFGSAGGTKAQLQAYHQALNRAAAEIDRLQLIIDGRPAINAALPQSYIDWSRGIYAIELAPYVSGGNG